MLRSAEAAKGTPAEARLAKEAQEATSSAKAWAEGYRQRTQTNRLGAFASGGVAFLSFMILVLTFVKRKDGGERHLSGGGNNQVQKASH